MSSAKIAFTYLYNEDNLTSSKRSHACTATLSAPAAGHRLLELLVQFDLDMEQQTGSKSGKEYVRVEKTRSQQRRPSITKINKL